MSKEDILKILLTTILSAIATYFITNNQIEKSRELAVYQLEQSSIITRMQLEQSHINWSKENDITINQKKQDFHSTSIQQLFELASELKGLRNQYYANKFSMLIANARLKAYPNNSPHVNIEFFNKNDNDLFNQINSKTAIFLSILNTIRNNYSDNNVRISLRNVDYQISSNFLISIDDNDIMLFYIDRINSLGDDRKAWDQTWEEYYKRSQNDYNFPKFFDILMANINT